MKKHFIYLVITLLFGVLSIFAQDISGPAPIIKQHNLNNGDITDVTQALILGCTAESFRVEAIWTDIGSPDVYRVEEIPFKPKRYLRMNAAGTAPENPDVGFFLTNMTDDVWSAPIALASNGVDMNFCYFGNQKNDFVISSNGILSFDLSYANNFSDWTIQNMGKISPDANCGDNRDAILQIHDTYPTHPSALNDSYSFWDIKGAVDERHFIMGYHHMPMYACGNTTGYATHQMVFYETTNIIEYHIQDKPLCTGWAEGYAALGIQNAAQDLGYSAPGRDNLEKYQILDLTDGFYDANFDPNFPVHPPEGWRYIPDGVNGVAPVFTWYSDYGTAAQAPFGVDPHDPNLFITAADMIAAGLTTVTYTAEIVYTDYCDNTITTTHTQEVTFELEDPFFMHIKEQNSTDDSIEFHVEEDIVLCTNQGYQLEALVFNVTATSVFTYQWYVETFGTGTVLIPGATNAIYDIPTTDPEGTYIYTCLVRHDPGNGSSNICVTDDTVRIRIADQDPVVFSYPAPKVFCASDDDLLTTPTGMNPVSGIFTINNGGVWLNPTPGNPLESLDGIIDLSASMDVATGGNPTGTGIFTITYRAGCQELTNTDTVTITDAPNIQQPQTATLINKCAEDIVANTADFDMDAITLEILNGLTGLTLNWVNNDAGGPAIPNPLTGTFTTPSVTIKLTAIDSTNPAACDTEIIFDLLVRDKPIANIPTNNLTRCEHSTLGNGLGRFDGSDIESQIVGVVPPTNYSVTYTGSGLDESGNTVDMPTSLPASGNFDIPTIVVTAYVTDLDSNCDSDPVTFTLEVRDIPLITIPLDSAATPLKLCETDFVAHSASFDTSNWRDAIFNISATNPDNPDYVIEYTYLDLLGNTVTTTNIPNPFVSISQTISIMPRNVHPDVTCQGIPSSFDIEVIETPLVAGIPDTLLTRICETDTDTDPAVHTADFDTSTWDTLILGPTQIGTGFSVNYTYTDASGTAITANTLPNPLTSGTQSINVSVQFTNATGSATCTSNVVPINLEIIENPTVTLPTTGLILCETNVPNHTAEFDTSTWSATILGTQSPADFSIAYTYINASGIPVTTATIPNPLISASQNISIVVTNSTAGQNACPSAPVDLAIAVVPIPTANRPVNSNATPLVLCETDAVAHTATFDGAAIEAFILGTQDPANYTVDYIGQVIGGFPVPMASLPANFTTTTIQITATVRLNGSIGCESSPVVFDLDVIETPRITPLVDTPTTNLILCETDEVAHTADFDTSTWNTTILGPLQGGPNYSVIYTVVDASGSTVTLPDPLPAIYTSTSTTVTAIVTETIANCDSNPMTFNLVVRETPLVTVPTIANATLVLCESDTYADPTIHTAQFDTSTWDTLILASNPAPINADFIIEYTYVDFLGTTVTTNALPNPLELTTQSINLVVQNVTAGQDTCPSASYSFNVEVKETPSIVAPTDTAATNLIICEDDTDTDPTVHTAQFDTSTWDAIVLDGQPTTDFYIEYTYTDTTGTIITSATMPNPFISASQTIGATVNIDAGSTACPSPAVTFNLVVRETPITTVPTDTTLTPLVLCEDDVDPNPAVHTAQFDTSNWNDAVLAAYLPAPNPDFIVIYSYNDGTSNVTTTALPNPLAIASQDILIQVINTTAGEDDCPSQTEIFSVLVNELPVVNVPQPIEETTCSGNDTFILDLDDYTSLTGNTYEWRALNTVDVIGETLTWITNTNLITDVLVNQTNIIQYVTYEIIPISSDGCRGELFTITVSVEISPTGLTTNYNFCTGEDFSIDLDLLTTLTGNTYVWSAENNPDVSGESTDTNTSSIIAENIINTSGNIQHVIYNIVSTSTGGCQGSSFEVDVAIYPQPEFELNDQYLICPETQSAIVGEDTNSVPPTLTYQWFVATDMNTVISNDMTITVTEAEILANGGVYALTATDESGCEFTKLTSVSMAEQMIITNVYVDDFNRPENSITVEVTGGSGDFEYTIRGTLPNHQTFEHTQTSNVFTGLLGSTYEIEVVDLSGCSVTQYRTDIHVLDYPPFFTPNGDTQNDTWQITGSHLIPNSKIYIFNRFGKVLAKIDPNNLVGWDGLYNGIKVPASDYWFSAEYIDPNTHTQKTVTGHFSIVRR